MIQNRFFVALILLAAYGAVCAGFWLGIVHQILRSTGPSQETSYLYIPKGVGLLRVSYIAAQEGLVRTPWHFRLAVRTRRMERSLFAGEYEVMSGATLRDILSQIKDQRRYQRRLVIPEGLSMPEVEAVLRQSFGLDLAGFQMSAEGSLLPDTYFYERGERASALVGRMERAQAQALAVLWPGRAPDLPFHSQEEALILASIVEKETAVAAERPLVAAVFVNRLRKGMRLQSDPTVIFGLTGGKPLDRSLTRADLQQITAYNTYRINGLPPTPIANPGREALAAVLNPADVPYLYFVADGSGGHAFASTLRDHNRNVARWRQVERKSRQ